MSKHVEYTPSALPASLPVAVRSGIMDAGEGQELAAEWAQALFCYDGMMRVEGDEGRWFVPDRCGFWLPGGAAASILLTGRAEVQVFSLHPRAAARLAMPEVASMLEATPLVRGVGRRLAPGAGLPAAQARRLGWVFLDELARLGRPDLFLPGSRDRRLSRVMALATAHPAETASLSALAAEVGSSARSLSRLFPEQTGLTWRDWRDRLRLVLAVEGLQAGKSSTELAAWLGYSSPSAFVAAFRRLSGKSPGAWRRGSGSWAGHAE